MPPLISLVLATTGRDELLPPLLSSLSAQLERRFELIVVDQSGDGRLEKLLQGAADTGFELIHMHQAERNLSQARNRGLQAARGAIVGFPDDDAWYEPDTLQQVVVALSGQPADDGLIAWWVDAEPGGLGRQGLATSHEWRHFRGGEASSITLFLRADAVRRWGCFDEALGVGQWYGAGEETDLLLRALAAGARLRHDAGPRVRHAVDTAAVMTWSQRVARARGTGALYAKHGLAPSVVMRGLLAPLLKLQRGGLAISWGRAQGLLAWPLGVGRWR